MSGPDIFAIMTAVGTLIIAIANTAMLITIAVMVRQYFLNKKTYRDDHERSRRQLAVQLLFEWNKNLERQGTIARKLIENFSQEQCKKLKNQEPFELETKFINAFKGCLNHIIHNDRLKELTDAENNTTIKTITVNEQESGELRWAIVKYLNNLEFIASAWVGNICDKDMIVEQFHYLISIDDNKYLLQTLRDEFGGSKSYPCICAFVEHLRTLHTPKNGKKDILGEST